jgi:hypothetical protein
MKPSSADDSDNPGYQGLCCSIAWDEERQRWRCVGYHHMTDYADPSGRIATPPEVRAETRAWKMADLEEVFAATQNPTYVWAAISRAGFDEHLPDWVRRYLRHAAYKIDNLVRICDESERTRAHQEWELREFGSTRSRLIPISPNDSATAAARKLSAALGFTDNGYNAFAERCKDNEAALESVNYSDLYYDKRETYVSFSAAEHAKSERTIYRRLKRARKHRRFTIY